MSPSETVFKNRKESGQKLAMALQRYATENPFILAMPRGGVVIGYEIAKSLHAPLDVIVTRKIGAPTQPEYAIGAIAPENIQIFNSAAISSLNISNTELEALISEEEKEMARRIQFYRANKPPLDLTDKLVIIVDDGVATGQTAIAAIRSVRKMRPKKIIFACGVSSQDALLLLQKEANEVVSLSSPAMFYAVSEWYQDFRQTTDEEVIKLLALSRSKL